MNGDTLDWKIDDEIVIASTDYDSGNAEKRKITGISNANTNPVISLDSPLNFKHFAGVESVGNTGTDSIEMRAEVGLLTRNIVF